MVKNVGFVYYVFWKQLTNVVQSSPLINVVGFELSIEIPCELYKSLIHNTLLNNTMLITWYS